MSAVQPPLNFPRGAEFGRVKAGASFTVYVRAPRFAQDLLAVELEKAKNGEIIWGRAIGLHRDQVLQLIRLLQNVVDGKAPKASAEPTPPPGEGSGAPTTDAPSTDASGGVQGAPAHGWTAASARASARRHVPGEVLAATPGLPRGKVSP